MANEKRRTPMTISLSPANPDAVVVIDALAHIPPRQRSATLLHWAAEYLQGRANAAQAAEIEDGLGLTDEEVDALLDAF
jgi:hypothetical protein